MKINAFELYSTAFDSACEYAQEKAEYLIEYAYGAFGVVIPHCVAQKILDCRAACVSATDNNGEWQNNAYHFIEKPLSDIEL